MSEQNVVLYGAGLLDSGDPATDQRQMQEVRTSGFNAVVLWTLHVQENGDFHYNNTPVVVGGKAVGPFAGDMPRLVSELRSGGTVSQVLFCIGSADTGDYANIKNLLATPEGQATLEANFAATLAAVEVDGFDFDLEEKPLSNFTDTVVLLALMIHQKFGKFVTFCPYYDARWWLGCAQRIYAGSAATQVVRWWNLQCYAGGQTNDPATWVELVRLNAASIGVADPKAYIVPGYWCAHGTDCLMGQCPTSIQKTFSGLRETVEGGFIWNSGNIFTCAGARRCGAGGADAYAHAVINGLSGVAVRGAQVPPPAAKAGAHPH